VLASFLNPTINEQYLRSTELALPVRLFLGGYGSFLKARCVRIGQIRSILIRLVEHFSPAAGISHIFLDQCRDQPDIVVGRDLAAGDFFYLQGFNPLVGNAVEMHEGTFCQRFGIGLRRQHLGHFHLPAGTVNRLLSQLDARYVAQTREGCRIQFGG